MTDITNRMVVVQVERVQPEVVISALVHRLHVGVMVRDPELDRNGKYMADMLNIINHLLFTAD